VTVERVGAEVFAHALDPFLDGVMERRLRHAVDRNLVHLHYQPVVDLSRAGTTTSSATSHLTASSRWPSPPA
jgi:EAL domain-containing protein (putative c-di-GMP-specific phosphodiesterase class I)